MKRRSFIKFILLINLLIVNKLNSYKFIFKTFKNFKISRIKNIEWILKNTD